MHSAAELSRPSLPGITRMDSAALRELLRPLVMRALAANSHKTLPAACERLGLPSPPSEDGMSRSQRSAASFSAVPDSDLPEIANRLIAGGSLTADERNALQDYLWAEIGFPVIPKKARHELARAIPIDELFINADRFDKLLDSLWVLDGGPFDLFFGGRTLRQQIAQHVHRNPDDWSTEDLFGNLGAFDATDRRFALFLEGLASSDVLPDEPAQRRFVETTNGILKGCGVELRESGTDGGYPVFSVVSLRAGGNRSPKNLIFASSVKPDIRFANAVDNDIEIVTHADKVLVYDRHIGPAGLRWRDLQQWWADTQRISNEGEAKKSLYWRLHKSLPDSSPPQRRLFEEFFHCFKQAVPDLPALLPEVWLHWDPKTVMERGTDALLRFRMDFLLLLPNGVRIVLEVDGKHHYESDDGKADPTRYAQMASGDRDLKLAGYEVFRFGAVELQEANAKQTAQAFFGQLFKLYRLIR